MRYLGAMIFALALAAPAAAQTGPATDLFAFSQGARLVQVPDDAEFTAMDSSPLNLIDGSATNGISVLASSDGSKRITVQGENLSLSGGIIMFGASSTISTQSAASSMIATVETSLNNVNSALARLGSGSKKLSVQATFVQNLSDTLQSGIGNLVDADMATESAKLQSLQVKQQLGVQALSIANQSPQVILSLFGR